MHSQKFLLLALLGSLCINAHGANINGVKWPGTSTEISVGIPGTSPSGIPWSLALSQAAQAWTDKTPFTFTLNTRYLDPCTGYSVNTNVSEFPAGDGDERNGADFSSSVCGRDFGSNVLAVTLIYAETNQLGAEDITETDIVFNANERFDVYDGPQRSDSRINDFRRIALHELGHVLGLGHENNARSIMNERIGNLFTLQADDIAGATTLYSGYRNCEWVPLNYGRSAGQLASGDCSVQQLLGGGRDDSLVDVYEFELSQPAKVTLEMRSPSLDSVLILIDANSAVLEVDDDGAGGCHARISRPLAAGTYAVLANTFADGSDCGDTFGPYELSMSYDSGGPLQLGRETSLRGGSSSAAFAGGVTQNKGLSYSNQVRASTPFDVQASITVDPAHRGRAGFIVIAAVLTNGEVLLRNASGEFMAYDAAAGALTRAYSKSLAAQESVAILSDFSASKAGITDIEVNFLVGYGLDSAPDELYFHSAPINVMLSP